MCYFANFEGEYKNGVEVEKLYAGLYFINYRCCYRGYGLSA